MEGKYCIECKAEVVWYYRSYFCKNCTINFFDKERKNKKKALAIKESEWF